MVRHVFVVSRERVSLYEYLLERFKDDPKVAVILDRRIGDRRRSEPLPAGPHERRKGDRRRPVPVSDDLRVRSHYIVEV